MTDIAPVAAAKPSLVKATWLGEHRFDAGKPDGPFARIDGSGHTGQTPPEALLSALSTCSGVDLVDFLAKRRTPIEKLVINVVADRRAEHPRRFEHIVMTYTVDGAGIERTHAERGLQLAFERYCSVAASLGTDIVIESIVVLNGDVGAPVRQPVFVPGR
ncbi:MAG: OsmC family protein [Gemmatimonadetes bacterium]|nr:OsmC family protein [Gemmatimonadota bacterium]